MIKSKIDILDIPVYRVSEDEYSKEWESSSEYSTVKNLDNLAETLEKRKLDAMKITSYEAMFKNFGGQWKYNDIIGFIRLHILGSQIRGEYYVTDKKRIIRAGRKIFKRKSDKLAIEIDLDIISNDNEKIFDCIKNYIRSCEKELNKGNTKKRYVDSKDFEKIGKYVDWIRLIHVEQDY